MAAQSNQKISFRAFVHSANSIQLLAFWKQSANFICFDIIRWKSLTALLNFTKQRTFITDPLADSLRIGKL